MKARIVMPGKYILKLLKERVNNTRKIEHLAVIPMNYRYLFTQYV